MKKYSYSAVGLFVKQIAISIFGLVLAIACAKMGKTMQIVSSCGAVIFYLFLIYAAIWEIGSKDRFGIQNGRIKANPLTGFYIGLAANSLNLLLAAIITVCMFLADGGVISAIGGVTSSIAIFIEGMYSGLLTIRIGESPLNSMWFSYFIITIPALVASTLAYYFGTKGYHFSKILIPENPEEAEIKREKKKARNKEE